jgi:UDP-N-acetyl-D-galactosamine dehydrogenase
VAEAAKVIENTQRDLNIALINELALIFNKMDIDTQAVLEAAGTKWNFLPFRPGLVGGHCIGVDPYYLTHKAQSIGYKPEIILAGRRLNDRMGEYVALQMMRAMIAKGIPLKGSRVLIMGLTFKENCPDLRNTRVVDIIKELENDGVQVDIYDPWVSVIDAQTEHQITPILNLQENYYEGILLAVSHKQFVELGIENIRKLGKYCHVIYDLKACFKTDLSDIQL